MAGMGPPPKPAHQRRRRNAVPGTVTLPPKGRSGRVPKWPLPTEPSDEEAAIWADLWKTPQAVAWERLGWERTVARYTQIEAEAEEPNAPVPVRAEARQMEDRLGLTPMAMLRLRWEIGDKDAEVRSIKPERAARQLRAVDPAG